MAAVGGGTCDSLSWDRNTRGCYGGNPGRRPGMKAPLPTSYNIGLIEAIIILPRVLNGRCVQKRLSMAGITEVDVGNMDVLSILFS